MEKELVLYGQECLDAVKAVQSKDVTVQRLKFMNTQIGDSRMGLSNRTFGYAKMWEKNDVVYYACDLYTIYLSASGKIFMRSKNMYGLTYEPNNKHTLKLWGKTSLGNIDPDVTTALLLRVGAEWALEKGKDNMYDINLFRFMYLRKDIFQRILRGRITNAEDLVRAWLKVDTRWRELKISHRAKTILTLMRRGTRLDHLIDFLSIVSNVEATLDMLLQGKRLGQWNAKDENDKIIKNPDGSWKREWDFDWFIMSSDMMFDIRKELVILGKKINSTWSHNRLMSEHTKMSRELLDLEVQDMVFEDHGYQTPCPVLPGMELIQDNIRLYSEGRNMSHCIYGYLNYAKERDNFHFHCIFGGEPFSLSVEWNRYVRTWNVQQMHGKYNKLCSTEQHAIIDDWVREDAVQAWFNHERALVRSDEDDNSMMNW